MISFPVRFVRSQSDGSAAAGRRNSRWLRGRQLRGVSDTKHSTRAGHVRSAAFATIRSGTRRNRRGIRHTRRADGACCDDNEPSHRPNLALHVQIELPVSERKLQRLVSDSASPDRSIYACAQGRGCDNGAEETERFLHRIRCRIGDVEHILIPHRERARQKE